MYAHCVDTAVQGAFGSSSWGTAALARVGECARYRDTHVADSAHNAMCCACKCILICVLHKTKHKKYVYNNKQVHELQGSAKKLKERCTGVLWCLSVCGVVSRGSVASVVVCVHVVPTATVDSWEEYKEGR